MHEESQYMPSKSNPPISADIPRPCLACSNGRTTGANDCPRVRLTTGPNDDHGDVDNNGGEDDDDRSGQSSDEGRRQWRKAVSCNDAYDDDNNDDHHR